MRLTQLLALSYWLSIQDYALNIDWLENQFELRYQSAPAVFQTLVQSIEMIMGCTIGTFACGG
jgi:hypothetical protein